MCMWMGRRGLWLFVFVCVPGGVGRGGIFGRER